VFGLSDDKTGSKPDADNYSSGQDDPVSDDPQPVTNDDAQIPKLDDSHTPAPGFWSDPVNDNDDPAADTAAELPDADDAPAPPPHRDTAGDTDLLGLKQHALQDLAPLVNHLDQTPEEKFKTTMMLIQASDNAALVPDAYEAAGKIQDEKARAQALLDVVNEINYFTHQKNDG